MEELENLDSLDSDVKEIESEETPAETEETEETTTEETTERTSEEVEGDETEEETEDEESEEEESEETEEDVIDTRISVKALKEQFPDIFKKNPGLKDVIFREREYSKVFGSIEDAHEAAERVDSFDKFEQTVLSGDIGSVIDAIAETNKESAISVVENFLPAVYERSKPLFAKITEPLYKSMFRSLYTRASNRGDKQLALACQYITRELYENADVMKATEYSVEPPDPRKKEIEEERQKLTNEQFTTARNDVLDVIKNRLKKEIAPRLDGKMSEFVRDATISKIIDDLDATLSNDKVHMAHLSSLWKRVQRAGFSSEAKSKIISASLARARIVLPAVINRVKASGKKQVVKKVVERQIPNQGTSKNQQQRSAGKLDRNVSDFEFLSRP